MRTTTVLTALLPVALSSVIPANEDVSSALSFDKRQDVTLQGLGGKILQADVYAGVAGLNQQIYQATKQSTQWKTCNPLNIIVRREWYVINLSYCQNGGTEARISLALTS
jgi:tyrosinase